MLCKEEKEIKEKLKQYGFNLKEVSNLLEVKYSTLNGYLNGFNPMPEAVREKIDKMIAERENIDTD